MIDSKMTKITFHKVSISRISVPKRTQTMKTNIKFAVKVPKPARTMKTSIKFGEKLNSKSHKLFSSAIPNEERILFVGDTSFADNYMSEYERRKEWGFNILEKYGRDHFFQKVKRLLLDADTVIANLETPLLNDEFITRPSFLFSADSRYVQKQGRFQHWSNGPSTRRALKK